jgi:hypothetical protein
MQKRIFAIIGTLIVGGLGTILVNIGMQALTPNLASAQFQPPIIGQTVLTQRQGAPPISSVPIQDLANSATAPASAKGLDSTVAFGPKITLAPGATDSSSVLCPADHPIVTGGGYGSTGKVVAISSVATLSTGSTPNGWIVTATNEDTAPASFVSEAVCLR